MFVYFVVLYFVVLLTVVGANDIFSLTAEDLNGNSVSLAKYNSAKAVLIVNVASNCGYTYTNYRELTDMYDRLHSKGLEILAFPCNQFGEQEPGTNEEIKLFVENYGVKFPVFSKIDVNGPTAHPVFKFLKSYTDIPDIGWNFAKFLVVKGYPVGRYLSKVNPNKIEKDILSYLDEDL